VPADKAAGTQFLPTSGHCLNFLPEITLPVWKNVVSLPRFFQVFQCDGKLKEAFLQTKTLILSNTTN
jgi:hypothetical protein